MASKSSKVLASTAVASQVVEAPATVEVKQITLTLPKGSKVTKSKRTIIAPPHIITAGKERWFETKRLTSYKVLEGGLIEITLPEHALAYRDMVQEG